MVDFNFRNLRVQIEKYFLPEKDLHLPEARELCGPG